MRYLVASVMLVLFSNTIAAPQESQLNKSVVTITFDMPSKKNTQIGFVIGDGNQVVTFSNENLENSTVLVNSSWTSKKLYSNSIKRSNMGVVVVHVVGLNGEPVGFSETKLKVGQSIYSGKLNANKYTLRKGSVSYFKNWQKVEGFFNKKLVGPIHEIFGHNISTMSTIGNPILNECGRVVGITRPKPKGFEQGKYALNSTQVISEIHSLGEIIFIDKKRCLSAQELATQRELELIVAEGNAQRIAEDAQENAVIITAQKKQAEKELSAKNRQKEKELKTANEKLKKAEFESNKAKLKLKKLEDKLKEETEKADLTELEKQKLKTDAELARVKFQKTQADLQDAEKQQKILQTDIEELVNQIDDERNTNDEKLKKYSLLVVCFLFIIVGIFVVLSNRKKARLNEAELRVLEVEKAAVLAEEEKTKCIAPYDCFLEGQNKAGKRYYLKIDRKVLGQSKGVILGRNPNDATYIIEDENISRMNTHLFIDGETLFVEDMNSANGTKVNGNVLKNNIPQVLRDGDQLEIGPVSFQVSLE